MTYLLRMTHVNYVTHDIILLINKMFSKEDRVSRKKLVACFLETSAAPDWYNQVYLQTARQAVADVALHALAQTLNLLKSSIALLSAETPDFIGPKFWPPNSSDLNPDDYVVWGILQEWVYCCGIRDVDHLKERLIAEWCWFDHNVSDTAVNQWREWLLGCVRENGGQFEHKL